jgi:hypothetical protein
MKIVEAGFVVYHQEYQKTNGNSGRETQYIDGGVSGMTF